MDDGVDIGSVGVHAGADDQSGLAVGIHSLARKAHARLQDEIAGERLPHEVEFVALGPHVHAGASERVLL